MDDPVMVQSISGPLIQVAGKVTKTKMASTVKDMWREKNLDGGKFTLSGFS